MLLKADSGVQKYGLAKFHLGTEDEFRMRRGNFVGIIQAREERYEFSVRDMRREQPTIHGTGVDFSHAVGFVTQLLDALTGTH